MPKLKSSISRTLLVLFNKFPNGQFHESISSVAEILGLSKVTTGRHLRVLCELGFLKKERKQDFWNGKCQPRYRYTFLSDASDYIDEFQKCEYHIDLRERVDTDEFKELLTKQWRKYKEGSESIKIGDAQFLLGVLFQKANPKGIVFGLGRKELAELVGCSPIKIKGLLNALFKVGILLKITQGVSGFFGIQPSIYHIDLNCELLKNCKHVRRVTIDVKCNDIPASSFVLHIDRQKTFFNHLFDEDKQSIILDNVKNLISSQNYRVINYLNDLINFCANEYILEVIANQGLDSLDADNVDDTVIDSINKTLEKAIVIREKSLVTRGELARLLARYVLITVYKIHCFYQRIVKDDNHFKYLQYIHYSEQGLSLANKSFATTILLELDEEASVCHLDQNVTLTLKPRKFFSKLNSNFDSLNSPKNDL